MKVTSQGKVIELNTTQQEAYAAVSQWYKYGNAPCFCISGPAGSGKTTLTTALIDCFIEDHRLYSYDIVVSAPTHKARLVAQQVTGFPSCTLHSLLGLAPDMDLAAFDPNSLKFRKSSKSQLDKYKLVIIDECSMINKELFDMINEALDETAGYTKVLYIGDEYQLAPINEEISPCFITTKNVIQCVHLTTVMRQAKFNPLLINCAAARDSQKQDSTADPTKETYNPKTALGLKHINKNDKDLLRKSVITMLKDDLSSKLLCFTNQAVLAYNKAIRSKVVMPGVTSVVHKGDRIMAYRTSPSNNSSISVRSSRFKIKKPKEQLLNSCEYEVTRVNKDTKEGMKVYVTDFINVDSGEELEEVNILDHTDEFSLATYNRRVLHLKEHALKIKDQKIKSRSWKMYYDFLNKYQTLIDTEQSTKSLDYGYAMTVHKSQGSTYNSVMIDYTDILKSRDVITQKRLLYVAISRPRFAAYLIV